MAQNPEKFRRPEQFLAELIAKSARGDLWDKSQNVQVWHRALVVAVDVIGGRLENPDGEGTVSHFMDGKNSEYPANVGPKNPRNSVKARIITKEFDQFFDDDSLRVFWPMFPEHDSIPIKPGEYVYVTFEDTNYEHGLWLGKVAGHENVNYFRGQDSFKTEDSSLASKFPDSPKLKEDPADTDHDASGILSMNDKAKLFND